MWNLKYNTNDLSMKQKRTHRHREQTCGCQGAVVGGKDWESGISRGKLLCRRQINNKVLPYSTGNCIWSLMVFSIMEKNIKKEYMCIN